MLYIRVAKKNKYITANNNKYNNDKRCASYKALNKHVFGAKVNHILSSHALAYDTFRFCWFSVSLWKIQMKP